MYLLDGSIKETNEQSADLIAKTYGVYSEKLFTDKATQIIEVRFKLFSI